MGTSLVVGANGFLGSALVNELISLNIKVLAVYNSNYESINKKATLIQSNEVLKSSYIPDYIYFVVGNYTNSHEELVENNNILAKYITKFRESKFIYISSTNVYGFQDNIITENSNFNNPSLYGLSKLSGEFIVSSVFNYAIIRFTYIYGPGINNESFLPQIIKSAEDLKKITIYGDGSRLQDYIYINDAVSFCISAARAKKSEIYLGATGVSVSNKQVAEIVSQLTNCELEFKDIDLGKSFKFNPSKTHGILNWSPKTSILEGLKKMIKI